MNLPLLRFPSLAVMDGLHHAVTLRGGGASTGPYASLNLGYHVGDNAALVTQNRRLLAAHVGYDPAALTCGQQVHGARSHVVQRADRGHGALDWDSALPETDALIVQVADTPVMLVVADCAPLLLADPVRRVLAVVHAGWRGAVAGIAGDTARRMMDDFDSHAEDIRAGIGPCLCPHCFEVGAEVAAAARHTAAIIPPLDGPGKPHLDLRALLRQDLESADLPASHIEAMPHCPRCQPDLFFSHRAQSGTAGRCGLVAWWD